MTVSSRAESSPPSYVGSVLPAILFMLVAGVVGPIFLVMGFVVDEPDTGWLLPTGLGITVLDVLIGFLVGRGRYRAKARMHQLRAVGRPARAQVLSFEETGVQINDQPVLVIQMRLHGGDFTPFEVQARQAVSNVRIPLLHAGELPVLIDPETMEWEIDWDSAKLATPSTLAPPADQRSSAERLAELDDLLHRDLLSREEYDETRARILDGL
ncbi:SHOCT domain-containing protein [Nocardioides sp. Root190]|uniref:SHOCT domain-containing protein n=1 Tax=Nocardioides sp. Root190 TaxID=1736488 RepID=UPI0012F9D1A3|nr:SHOCT domain-containing protein [Nocardioides sp. Root190]